MNIDKQVEVSKEQNNKLNNTSKTFAIVNNNNNNNNNNNKENVIKKNYVKLSRYKIFLQFLRNEEKRKYNDGINLSVSYEKDSNKKKYNFNIFFKKYRKSIMDNMQRIDYKKAYFVSKGEKRQLREYIRYEKNKKYKYLKKFNFKYGNKKKKYKY